MRVTRTRFLAQASMLSLMAGLSVMASGAASAAQVPCDNIVNAGFDPSIECVGPISPDTFAPVITSGDLSQVLIISVDTQIDANAFGNSVVISSGDIVDAGPASLGDGIDLEYSTLAGFLRNNGTVRGLSGIYINESQLEGIVNSGTVEGTSSPGISIFLSTLDQGLTNNGTITGTDGVRLRDTDLGTTGLVNNNTIRGTTGNGITINTEFGPSSFGGLGGGFEECFSCVIPAAATPGDFSGTITNTDSITGLSNGIYASTSTFNLTLINSGLVGGDFGTGVRVIADAADLTVSNSSAGVISGNVDAFWVTASQIFVDINNAGTFTAPTHAIDLGGAQIDATIINSGDLLGGAGGIAIAASGTLDAAITNQSGGSIVSTFAPGIFLNGTTSNLIVINSGSVQSTSAPAVQIIADQLTGTGTGGLIFQNTASGNITGANGGVVILANNTIGTVDNQGNVDGGNGAGIQIGQNFSLLDAAIFAGPGSFTGDIINSGDASGLFGVEVNLGTLNGNVVNTANGTATGDLNGYYIDVFDWTGNFSNAGTVTGLGGDGLLIATSNWGGNFLNSGTIRGTSNGASIWINSGWIGNFTNSRAITGDSGAGVVIAGDGAGWTGHFANNTAQGAIKGTSEGVDVALSTWNGDFSNAGTVEATASNGTGFMANVTNWTGMLTNSGTIRALGAGGDGIVVSASALNLDFNNTSSGVIRGGETGALFTAASITGTFENHGDIIGAGLATGWHIVTNTFTGPIINGASGVLSAGSNALHLEINTLDGPLENAGDIIATSSTGVAARLAGRTTPGVYLEDFLNTGDIIGGTSGTGILLTASIADGIINEGIVSAGTALDASGSAGALVYRQQGVGAQTIGDLMLTNASITTVDFRDGSFNGDIFGAGGNDSVQVNLSAGDTLAFRENTVVQNIANFQVNSGTAILGSSLIGGTGAGMDIINGGALSVASNARLYLDDNTDVGGSSLTTSSNSALIYRLTADETKYGQIAVTGGASLAGAIQAALDPLSFAGSSSNTYFYDNVISSSNRTGSFDTVSVLGNTFGFALAAEYETNNVDLRLTRTSIDQLDCVVTGNQQSVAEALEQILQQGGFGSDLGAALSALYANGNCSELVTLPGPSQAQIGFNILPIGEIWTRQVAGETSVLGSTSCVVAGGMWCRNLYAANDGVANDASDPFAWAKQGYHRESGRTSIWGRGVGAWSESDGDMSGGDTETETGGFIIGGDHTFTPEFLGGLAALWSTTEIDFPGTLNNGEVDTTQVGGYFSWGGADLYVNGNLSFLWHDFESARVFTVGPTIYRAFANYDGSAVLADGEVGKIFEHEGWRIQPFLGLRYSDLTIDAYTETGAGGLGLAVDEQEQESLKSILGLRASTPVHLGTQLVVIEGRAAWTHEFLDTGGTFLASFADPAALPFKFLVAGDERARDFGTISFGIAAPVTESLTIFLDGDAAFSEDTQAQVLSAGIRAVW